MNKIKMEVISIVKWEDKEVPVADLLKELLVQNAKQKNTIYKALKDIDEYKKIFDLDLFSTALENIETKLRGEE